MLIVQSEIMVILLALRNSTNQKRIWLRSRQLRLPIKLSTRVYAATKTSILWTVKRTLPWRGLSVSRKLKRWTTQRCKYIVRKTLGARVPSRSFSSKKIKPLGMRLRSRPQCSHLQTKLKIRIWVKWVKKTWLRDSATKCWKKRTSNSKRKLNSCLSSLFKLSQP